MISRIAAAVPFALRTVAFRIPSASRRIRSASAIARITIACRSSSAVTTFCWAASFSSIADVHGVRQVHVADEDVVYDDAIRREGRGDLPLDLVLNDDPAD